MSDYARMCDYRYENEKLRAALLELTEHLRRIPYRDVTGLRATMSPHFEKAAALLQQGEGK